MMIIIAIPAMIGNIRNSDVLPSIIQAQIHSNVVKIPRTSCVAATAVAIAAAVTQTTVQPPRSTALKCPPRLTTIRLSRI